jgi:putative SOS response-associated peptidase YedK
MCGRYTHLLTWRQVVRLYRLTDSPPPNDFGPRYNIAPTERAPVVREREGNREAAMLRWGLIPFWAKDKSIGVKTINARAETVATAPDLREAWRARRCLIPTSGFYEWVKAPDGRQPFLIGFQGPPTILLCRSLGALDKASGEKIETYTIITGQPNEVTAPIHNRMPVIIDPQGRSRRRICCGPHPASEMLAYGCECESRRRLGECRKFSIANVDSGSDGSVASITSSPNRTGR